MIPNKPRPRRKPRTTPEPLLIVSGLPGHIQIDRYTDHCRLRCTRCGELMRVELPVMTSGLQGMADGFAGEHGHAPTAVDPDMLADAAEWLYEMADGRRPSEAARDRVRRLAERLQAASELLRGVKDE